MSKALLFLSFVSLSFLILGSILFPSDSVMWLATTTLGINVLRGGLAFIALILLVTEPPRNAYFRMLVGFLTVGTAAWGMAATYNNAVPLLDGASLLLASVSMGAVALEFRANDRAEEAYSEAAQAAVTRTAAQH